ncbi:MAG: methyl-accepting chemotaxis protein [Desulfomonile tiedjei]|nr:methyl-accepting chemotaxis protein [Desulfomonile tiedjei]
MKMRVPTIRRAFMGFGVVSVILLAIPAVATHFGFSQAEGFMSGIRDIQQIIRATTTVQKTALEVETALGTYVRGGGQEYLDRYRNANDRLRAGLKKLKQLVSANPAQARQVEAAEASLTHWDRDVANPAIQSRQQAKDAGSAEQGKPAPSQGLKSESLSGFSAAVLAVTDGQLAASDDYLRAAAEKLGRAELPTILGLPAYAVLLLIVSFLLSGVVAKPIAAAASLAETIRRGELSQRISVTGLDEARRLGSSLNEMADGLATYNRRILEGIDVLTNSIAQIAATASQLFSSASQTAASVTETNAVLEEMQKAATVVNQTAGRVAEHSEKSEEIADSGIRATSETVQKMTLMKEKMDLVSSAVLGLSDNTKYVEGIIAAVQDLANQSNLLAVNASIEAARAGEHGKGFAVVAHEIKSLADQSREATTQVTKILQEIRKSVGSVVMATEEGGKAVLSGVEQSESAGEAIQRLADSIREFAQGAGVIFSSSGNQFGRVARATAAMKNVELATHSSVEGTTQLENEAKRLEQLALSLQNLVRQYKLEQPGSTLS